MLIPDLKLLLDNNYSGADLETVTSQVEHHKADSQQLASHAPLIDSLKSQEGLCEEDQDLLDEILNKWDRCNELSDDRKNSLSAAFNQILDFEKTLADVGNFMDTVEAQLIENDGVPLSSIDIVEDMMAKHKVNINGLSFVPKIRCGTDIVILFRRFSLTKFIFG